MKRLLLIFLSILFTFTAFSQQVSFSNEIKNTEDENVKQIAEIWEKYIQKCWQQPDSAAMLYWNSIENRENNLHADIIRFNFPDCFYYRTGKVFTYNIKPSRNNDFYEINSMSLIKKDNEITDVLACFRVCAAKENNEFKLYNYFYTIKDNLNSYLVDGIEYYYPKYYEFDKEKAQQSSDFLQNMHNKYNIAQKQPIIYIVSNSLDECNELIGFNYTVMSNTNKNAGSFRFPNILIAAKVNHIHELTHSIFDIVFNSSTLMSEGIATYYGGNAGIQLPELKKNFKQYVAANTETDLSDFNAYYKLLEDGSNPVYTVGALIIEHSMKNGGEQAVVRLLKYSDDNIYDLFLNEFGIKREEVHNFILQLVHDE
ncbi:MAG: hypothetical protein LBP63_00150 [Prevotellaceae bacterium]|nr:hypothetical protein [Prevotellaceae bacterium]